MQKDKKLRIARIIKFLIIPSFLGLLWLTLSLLYINKNAGITILVYPHNIKNTLEWKTSELLAGEKAAGEFVSRDNNLGIIAVRFNTFFRINDDVVRFRIRKKGNKNWDYENNYTTPQFQPNQLFTFGFPIIPDSAGKIYQFEIESLRGEPGNAVALSTTEPIYVTKYQYSKELITSNRNYAITFIYKKTINSITNLGFILASFAYALPLLVYLIWLLLFKKYLSKKYYLVLLPIILMLIVSITNTAHDDSIVLGLIFLWSLTLIAYQLESTISLFFSLTLIIISPLLLTIQQEDLSKNITMWGYILLVIGIFQLIYALRAKNKKLINLSEFTKKIGLNKPE